MNNQAVVFSTYANKLTAYQEQPFACLRGINPLVEAAMPLLLLMIKFKQTQHIQQSIGWLRQVLVEEVVAFVERATCLQYSPRLVLAARYCLCSAMDEVILSTAWGGSGEWSSQTLLSIMQKETWGGERFYIILEEMAKAPRENLALLELLYMVLSLGFEGRYYDQPQAARDEIKYRLFHLIRLYKKEPDKWLSPSLTVFQQVQAVVTPAFSGLKIIGFTVLIIFFVGVVFNIATYLTARTILQEVMTISQSIQSLPMVN